jgi:hypothetical protein
LTSTFAISKGCVAVTGSGSSAEVARLFKARELSLRLLLMGAVSVLAGVVFTIWSTVSFMRQPGNVGTFPGQTRVNLGDLAVTFLIYGGNAPFLLPLVMILVCGCFVLIHRPPQSSAAPLLWTTPSSRFAGMQAEVVGLGLLVGVLALIYAGAAILGLAASPSLLPVEQLRGASATILASSAATTCLFGVLLTYWWILGIPGGSPRMLSQVSNITPTTAVANV